MTVRDDSSALHSGPSSLEIIEKSQLGYVCRIMEMWLKCFDSVEQSYSIKHCGSNIFTNSLIHTNYENTREENRQVRLLQFLTFKGRLNRKISFFSFYNPCMLCVQIQVIKKHHHIWLIYFSLWKCFYCLQEVQQQREIAISSYSQ